MRQQPLITTMSRPPTGRSGERVTLYIKSKTLANAKRYAFDHSRSLSDVVTRLLEEKMRQDDAAAALPPGNQKEFNRG